MRLFIFMLLITRWCLAAEMYKWLDEEGNLQYTQTPPPNTSSTLIKGLPNYSVSGGRPVTLPANEDANLSPECLKLQNLLKEMYAGKIVVMPDAENSGKFISMPEAVRQQRIKEYQSALAKDCKNLPLPTAPVNKPVEKGNSIISDCNGVRDYLAKLNSGADWIIPDPGNPDKFIKMNEAIRQQKIAEATAFSRNKQCTP